MDPMVIAGAAGAWAWSTFGKDLIKKSKDLAGRKWERFQDAREWERAAQTYRDNLRQNVATIRVLGKSDPVELTDVFTDVYILDQVTGRLHYDFVKLREQDIEAFDRFDRSLHRERQERVSGLEMVQRDDNLFILGKPGAGKTTFLKYIALQALNSAHGGDQAPLDRVPIFVSLKEWSMAGMDELLPFLAQQFDKCNFPDAQPFVEKLLHDGKALVLFDGLDEVNQEGERRGELTRLLQNFSQKYRPSQMLITCRIAASDYLFEGFADVEVADFTRDQIHSYAHKWFGEDEKTRGAFFAGLYRDENEGLRELCAQPLLLAMLCLAFSNTGYFPQHRINLYEEALDALLRKWDRSRAIRRDQVYQGLSYQRKIQMFSEIAAETFENDEYFIERRRLEQLVARFLAHPLKVKTAQGEETDAGVVLRSIEAQHGILEECALNIYAFSHLTFQEYFTAKYIADNKARGTTYKLAHHVGEKGWREVVLLTIDLLHEADGFLKHVWLTLNTKLTADNMLRLSVKWAEQKGQAANLKSGQRQAVRLAYFYLANNVARDLAFPFEGTLALALDLAFTLSRDIGLARVLARGIALTRARELARVYDTPLGVNFALLYTRIMSCTFAETSRFEEIQDCIPLFHNHWVEVLQFSAETPLDSLLYSLHQLAAPAVEQPQEEWRSFSDNLLQIMRREGNIVHNEDLDKNQIQLIEEYFSNYTFLLTCLKLASVSPETRQVIETGLLLLPEA